MGNKFLASLAASLRYPSRSRLFDRQLAGQKDADFYDRTFEADDSWRSHYTQSPYYFIWTVLLDRLRRAGSRRLLEIACGSGQLASAIHDARLVSAYCGFDFSRARVAFAQQTCPQFQFHVADALTTELFGTFDYDTAIATEFLEHVDRDVDVLDRLRPGTRFFGTVPNFPFVSHVRHFEGPEEVTKRYGSRFTGFSVVSLQANHRGKTFFLMEGCKIASPRGPV